MNPYILRLADTLYRHAYPVYLPLYSGWKAITDASERKLFRSLVREGMVIVDVGANIGIYSSFLAGLIGPSGRLHAFEPAPVNFERLRRNSAALPNIIVNQAAVGNASGTIDLMLSDEINVDHRVYDVGSNRSRLSVPLVRLDDYFAPDAPSRMMAGVARRIHVAAA